VRIGLVHPGEMGSAVGACLVGCGHEVLWASAGRSSETAERAERAGLVDAGTLDELAERSEAILSICPPHAALAVAGELEGFAGIYVDGNAVSPETAREVAALHPRLVDGGIVGGPPASGSTSAATRLYLSGAEAPAVAALFAGSPLATVVLSAEVGHASALKMVYAAWSKGSSALLLAIREVARSEGVDEALVHEWESSQPDLPARYESARSSAAAKGWRWVGEMEEIAATFAANGEPDGFHLAAAEVFRGMPRPTALPAQ
jgi:3-hydroxyisobutyrate dehydrogenase-like beta-hydroxyacid dehydrogenase